jgi:hypothetical protein
VQNAWASDWDNVAFDLSLKAVPLAALTDGMAQFSSIQPNPDGSVTLFVTGAVGTTWTVQSSDNARAGSWRDVGSVVIGSSTGTALVDGGQNGQAPFNTSSNRFYRLTGP